MYLSDRQRVELALPARFLWSIIQCGADGGHEASQNALKLIQTACIEPLDGLHGQDKLRIARRIDRVFSEAMEPLTSTDSHSISAGKAGLIVYYFIVDLVDRNILELYADTPMADAITQILPELSSLIAIKSVDKSAQKQAEKLFTRLRNMGFYATLRAAE